MLAGMTGTKSSGQSGGIDITKIFDSVNTNISSANKPELITSDIMYTGTLKALKEISGVTSPEPIKLESKTLLTVPAIPPVNVVVPDIPQVKVAEVKAPVIPPVTVTMPEVKAPVIPPVTVATPKTLTPSTKTDKTDSIIDKQLAKFGIDIGNFSGKLPTVTPDVGIKKIFDSVSTTISSVTGGGSTTRKSVQNEDSKAAQSQLESLMSQYNKDRTAISSKISESMGIDAKRGDVLKELKANPEAIALEARMKSMSSDLYNRIGAGTSVETTFESGIQRGNIVEKSTTSVPITEAMKGSDSVSNEYEKEQSNEESQTIDLTDSEPKTKDLYDQLIQLNSSIRQLVEHSASGVDLAGAQIKATRGLSGNRFA
jgi:hypothetical protein